MSNYRINMSDYRIWGLPLTSGGFFSSRSSYKNEKAATRPDYLGSPEFERMGNVRSHGAYGWQQPAEGCHEDAEECAPYGN